MVPVADPPATTAFARHTARAVAPFLPSPQAVVQAVNRALIKRPGEQGTGFVTLVHGHFTADSGGLDITPWYAPATDGITEAHDPDG